MNEIRPSRRANRLHLDTSPRSTLLEGIGTREIMVFYPANQNFHDRQERLELAYAVENGVDLAIEDWDRLKRRFGLPEVPFPAIRTQDAPLPLPARRGTVDALLRKRELTRVSVVLSEHIPEPEKPPRPGSPDRSHLLEIHPRESRSGWLRSGSPPDAFVYASVEQLRHLVADVLLDIWTVRSLAVWHPPLQAMLGEAISKAKVALIKKLGLPLRAGPLGDVPYIPLSSAVSAEHPFTDSALKEYIGLWGRLLPGRPVLRHTAEGFLAILASQHRRTGQLSMPQVASQARALAPGRYWFVLTHRPPRVRKVQEAVAHHMGRRVWKQNLHCFVPEAQAGWVRAYANWLTVLDFEIREPEVA